MIDAAYQTDHLLLLVGGNPVPNAVAAHALVKPVGTVHLVHSTGSRPVAERLAKWIRNRRGASTNLVPLSDETDADTVYDEVFDAVQDLEGSIGLHYTGGRKAMSVHAYRAVMDKDADAIFSYLDPVSSAFRFDHDGGKVPAEEGGLTLLLDDLVQLHGWKYQGVRPTGTPLHIDLANEVFKQCQTDEGYKQWAKNVVRPNRELRKGSSPSKWTSFVLPELGKMPCVDLLRQKLGMQPQAMEVSYAEASRALGFGNTSKGKEAFVTWIESMWMESVVMEALLLMSKTLRLHDIAMNVVLEPTDAKEGDVYFEFDVVALRGYQLFAFSCTVDTAQKMCKSKLFEAYVHATQFGGSEARVALVCNAPDEHIEFIERNLRQTIGTDGTPHAERQVRVFGKTVFSDLNSFADALMEWINRT